LDTSLERAKTSTPGGATVVEPQLPVEEVLTPNGEIFGTHYARDQDARGGGGSQRDQFGCATPMIGSKGRCSICDPC